MKSIQALIVLDGVVPPLLPVEKKLCLVLMKNAVTLVASNLLDGIKKLIAVFLVVIFGTDAILSVGNFLQKMLIDRT